MLATATALRTHCIEPRPPAMLCASTAVTNTMSAADPSTEPLESENETWCQRSHLHWCRPSPRAAEAVRSPRDDDRIDHIDLPVGARNGDHARCSRGWVPWMTHDNGAGETRKRNTALRRADLLTSTGVHTLPRDAKLFSMADAHWAIESIHFDVKRRPGQNCRELDGVDDAPPGGIGEGHPGVLV